MSEISSFYEAVRQADPQRSLLALFLSAEVRETALALLLLNAELARIPGSVQDPAAGLFRFQFWREAVLSNGTSPAAWTQPLKSAIADGRLRSGQLSELFDGRALLLDGLADASAGTVEGFARRSSGILQRLIAGLLTSDDGLLAKAEDLGTAYGLAGIRPALAGQLARGRPIWSGAALAQSGWRPEQPLDSAVEGRLAEATLTLLDRAKELIHQKKPGATPRSMFGVFALGRITAAQIKRQVQMPGRLTPLADDQLPPWTAPYLALRWLFNAP